MARSIVTFLMFQGDNRAEDAMQLYASVVPGAEITELEHFGPGEQGREGTVRNARMSLCGYEVRFFDSPAEHAFTFTPATSFFVECESADELDRMFATLSEGGAVFMPLSNYGFSTRFGWCSDRFGVAWQLNLA
jgi:predicted 3-demethylubiquinone-9 3-methyltransferase (glyoxalase superfamily)